MALISLRNIKKGFGEVEILKDINFHINLGDKIGLVGDNGAGKTTLANIICKNLKEDGGTIKYYNDKLTIGYLHQGTSYIFKKELYNKLEQKYDKDKFNDYLKLCSFLGVNVKDILNEDTYKVLSGGEKAKLALSYVWASNPEMLVLDEPTNHLDFKSIEWLIEEIKKYKGTLIIISHNRYFLDQCVNKIAEIQYGMCKVYEGDYTFYREEKKKDYENRLHRHIEDKKYIDNIEQAINNLRNWSSIAHNESKKRPMKSGNKKGGKEYYRVKAKKMDSQVKSKINRLEKLKIDIEEKPKEEQKIFFAFDVSEKKGNNVLQAVHIEKTYDNNCIFKDSSFYIKRGEKIGLIGDNGCGKTTLIKCILGTEDLDKGTININPSLKIGYLSQDIVLKNENINVLKEMEAEEGQRKAKAYEILINMGFDENMINRNIKSLSFGELMRVKLAKLILEEKDCLILDEPTNHLDLHSREMLEDALLSFQGTILIVSHDRYMLERVCNKLIIFKNKGIERAECGFKEFSEKSRYTNSIKHNEDMHLKHLKEELLILKNDVSAILGQLSIHSTKDERYNELDLKFKELIKRKRTIEDYLKQ